MFSGLIVMGILKHRVFLISMIVILVLFLLLAPLPIKERILSIADFNHPSIKSRFVMWETGLKIIKDHPVFGIGEVDLKKIYVHYKPIEFHAEGSHMHNNFLQLILNLGIPGFLIWLSLIVYIFIRQIKICILTKKHFILNALALASLISMVAFQISGLTEWNFSDFEFAAVLWFNLSLAFIVEKLYKQHLEKA
jgi:O-antigen ligase